MSITNPAPKPATSASGSRKKQELTWRPLVAGGTAGAIEAALMYPTEYIKTQLQLARSKNSDVVFKGPWDCVQKTVRANGIKGLYVGVNTLVLGSFFKSGVRFFTFDAIKNAIVPANTKATAFQTMTAGLCAGVCEAVIAVTPTETLKTRLIHDRNQPVPRYQGLVHATRTIIAEEGIQGMYRGLVPTMLKQGCNQASRFAVYTAIVNALRSRPRKSVIATPEGISSDFTSSLSVPTAAQEAAADSGIAALPATSSSTSSTSSADSSSPSSSSSSTLSSHPTHTPPPSAHATESASKPSPPTNTTASTTSTGKTARVNPWSSLAAGATAGFVSVYITMPFDIVKTRMQGLERLQYSGSWDCLKRIYQQEGLRAYWRGTTPRLGRVTCSSSIVFTAYEQIVLLLDRLIPPQDTSTGAGKSAASKSQQTP